MAIGRVAAQLVHRSCADVPIGETRGDGGWWDGVGTPHANVSSWCLFREPRSRDSGGSEMPSPSEGPGFRIHSDPEGSASPTGIHSDSGIRIEMGPLARSGRCRRAHSWMDLRLQRVPHS